MSTPYSVAVLVGSLRKESFSRKTAKALIALAPASLKPEIVEIGALPLYNQDDDANPPAASVAFKARIAAADHRRMGRRRLENSCPIPTGSNDYPSKGPE